MDVMTFQLGSRADLRHQIQDGSGHEIIINFRYKLVHDGKHVFDTSIDQSVHE